MKPLGYYIITLSLSQMQKVINFFGVAAERQQLADEREVKRTQELRRARNKTVNVCVVCAYIRNTGHSAHLA